jgi:aspartate/methionine/tyrosine aminotransferase
MDKINLGWGSPDFLKPYWDGSTFQLRSNLDTTYFFGTHPELKDAIIRTHAVNKNAVVANKHIVVTNGATQALNALLYCLAPLRTFAEPPHYHKFPEFAKLQGIKWAKTSDSLQICTIPNNPDYSFTFGTERSIYDLSYNWPMYMCGEALELNYDIMVFSMSKATGHATTRIGWILCKDEALARKLDHFVEHSSGVSLHTQLYAAHVLKTQNESGHQSVWQYGEKVLMERWVEVTKLQRVLPYQILNNSGMFLWCKGKPPTNCIVVMGSELGSTDEYFRINLGCSEENWNKYRELYATHVSD